jgi:hypothetical protein
MASKETASGANCVAVSGEATGERSVGLLGKGEASGVRGEGKGWNGVEGFSQSTVGGAGVYGGSDSGAGVRGESKAQYNPGVHGIHNCEGGLGVLGEGKIGAGVVGKSQNWHGVHGESQSSKGGVGVYGEHKTTGVGVSGYSEKGTGIYGKGGELAGHFEGNVTITGTINCPKSTINCNEVTMCNADCAEDFDIADDTNAIEPGTVMVLGDEGALSQSRRAYDKRVAGVISGAGNYKPGIVLDKQPSQANRKPIALMGKVYCKVDAEYSSIEVGDLLTTSPSPGHAMKASNPTAAFGAVIGKALRPLRNGQGLIPVLIALQ